MACTDQMRSSRSLLLQLQLSEGCRAHLEYARESCACREAPDHLVEDVGPATSQGCVVGQQIGALGLHRSFSGLSSPCWPCGAPTAPICCSCLASTPETAFGLGIWTTSVLMASLRDCALSQSREVGLPKLCLGPTMLSEAPSSQLSALNLHLQGAPLSMPEGCW